MEMPWVGLGSRVSYTMDSLCVASWLSIHIGYSCIGEHISLITGVNTYVTSAGARPTAGGVAVDHDRSLISAAG